MAVKKTSRILLLLAILLIGLVIYTCTFPDLERVCNDKEGTEVYLLHYISKSDLKNIVLEHNKNFSPGPKERTRVYLLAPILKIPDPVFGDEFTYKPDGCDQIDNMDIYCEVRYSKMKNGEMEVRYNFME